MTNKLTESAIETFALALLEKLGYRYVYAPDIAPDSVTPERERFEDVLLLERLRSAVARINPSIPANVREEAIKQVQRPDYDLSNNRVQVKLTGKVLDMDYARLLAGNGTLSLQEIIALDKVQKHQPLDGGEEKLLKGKGLIEGRKPNFFIAKPVAQQTGQKASYSKNRAFDKQYYLDLICKAVGEHGSLTRKEIDDLLWAKLPDWMNDTQRKHKVGNLLGELRKTGLIRNAGSMKCSSWVLVKGDVK